MLIPKHAAARVKQAGFSLIELIVAITILSILAAAFTPYFSGMGERGRVAKALQLAETMKLACQTYHLDTGAYPHEYAGYGASNRKLSAKQSSSRWKGPYIESPLVHGSTNPFGGTVHLYNTVTANGWINGFDIDADGALDVKKEGNMLYLSGVPETAAVSINEALDGEQMPGDWNKTGHVRYDAAKRSLFILVHR